MSYPSQSAHPNQESCGAYSACYAMSEMHIIDLNGPGADAIVQGFYGVIQFSQASINNSNNQLKPGYADPSKICKALKSKYNVKAKMCINQNSPMAALTGLLENSADVEECDGVSQIKSAGWHMGIFIYQVPGGLHYVLTKFHNTFSIMDSNWNPPTWKQTSKSDMPTNASFTVDNTTYTYTGAVIVF